MKFALIGSGYRAHYYMDLCLRHKKDIEITSVLVRSAEKKEKLEKEYPFFFTTNEEDILSSRPDFIVVAVKKGEGVKTARRFTQKGFCVLTETPVSIEKEELEKIEKESSFSGRLLVAEQYPFYPTYRKIIDIVNSGLLGKVNFVHLSICHDYHAMRMIRSLLNERPDAEYTIQTIEVKDSLTRTRDRYNTYLDGAMEEKPRTLSLITFEDGKTALYDFSSSQYHSSIRHNILHITGSRGEIINENLWYLDGNNSLKKEIISPDFQKVQEEKEEDLSAIFNLLTFMEKVKDAKKEDEVYQEAVRNLENAVKDSKMHLDLMGTL